MKKHVCAFFTINKSLSQKELTDKKVGPSIFQTRGQISF